MLIQRLPLLVTALMLALLAGLMFVQLAPLLQQDIVTETLAGLPEQTPQEQTSRQRGQHDIDRFDLFGSVLAVTEQPVAQEPEQLPETTLRLKLTGILSAAADDTLAGALIEGPDRETLYYRPGESLPGNATLKQVYPDRVVIDRSGRLENLYFPEEFNSPALASYQEPAQDESATYDYNQDQSGSSEPEEVSASQVGEARKASIKERLSKLRSRLMNNR